MTWDGVLVLNSGTLTEKRRYFWLDVRRELLIYFQSEERKQQLGVIDLSASISLEECTEVDDPSLNRCSFSIVSAHRIWYLRADSLDDAKAWVQVLEFRPPSGRLPL